MVKVIGFDESAKKRCTCPRCAAIIEYTLNERLHRQHTSYDMSTDRWKVIRCPSCYNDIKVK